MATPLVITNSALIKAVWSNGTRTWLNVLGATLLVTPPTFNQALADAVTGAFNGVLATSGLLPLLATSTTFLHCTVRDLRTANQPEWIGANVSTVGTGTGDVLPLSVAAVATFRTNQAGRSFRGRTYFSGFTEAQNDATGRTAPAVNTAIVAFLNAFNTALQGSTINMQLAVLSRPAPTRTIPQRTLPSRVGQGNPVTLVLARNTKWESQRRRTGRT